jgi:hypothetical protein
VFLPPKTEFRAQNGRGEMLLVGARQPQRPPVEGRAALSNKPLLPLAGSGKAFDPATGEWMPAESFPTSAESLPPRRMQRLPAGSAMVERVLAPDYKAATLSVDEAVLAPGTTLRLGDVPGLAPAEEVLLFARSDTPIGIGHGSVETRHGGDVAFLLPCDAELRFTAGNSPAYVLFAYAGKN